MKKVAWFLTPFLILIISHIAYAQQQQPDPVFSTTAIYPGTWDTGPDPDVIYAGDKIL